MKTNLVNCRDAAREERRALPCLELAELHDELPLF